jgi:hypothetical protein
VLLTGLRKRQPQPKCCTARRDRPDDRERSKASPPGREGGRAEWRRERKRPSRRSRLTRAQRAYHHTTDTPGGQACARVSTLAAHSRVRSAGAAASQRSEPVVVAVVAHYSSSNCMLGSYLVGVITWVCPVSEPWWSYTTTTTYLAHFTTKRKEGFFFFLRESEKRASDQKRCHRTYADTPAQLMLTLRC